MPIRVRKLLNIHRIGLATNQNGKRSDHQDRCARQGMTGVSGLAKSATQGPEAI